MRVVEDEVQTENGKNLTYGVVQKKPFALVVPWDGTSFTLVRQYRYALDAVTLEFPQGHYEHDSLEETARAELREETGLRAGKIKEIGRMYIAPGFCSQECFIFLATDVTQGEPEREEGEEGMEAIAVDYKKFQHMVEEGLITDAPTIAAWALLRAKNLF